jgi:hypothetical protein
MYFLMLLMLLLPNPLAAQSVENLLITTGTSTRGTDGQLWIYITWGTQDISLLSGRCLSVNFKTGDATSANTYTRQAIIRPMSRDPFLPKNAGPGVELVHGLISRATCLGENMADFDSLVADGLRGLSQEPVSMPGTREERFATLMAKTDPVTQGDILPALRRVSPASAMIMGLGWAGPVSVAQGSPVTVELRDHDLGLGQDRGVLGRVTLNVTGLPDLPAVSAPVQVPDLTAESGDLNVQLRWGLPVELARRIAQVQGFSVWRVSKTLGLAQPWIGTGPSVAQLTALVTGNPTQAKRMKGLPIREQEFFTPTQAADVVTNSTSVFFTDDNDRYATANNVVVGVPFTDGAENYYFLGVHDLLGRLNAFSGGTLMQAVRTIPPPVPSTVEVVEQANNVATGPTAGNLERCVTWIANTNTATDRTDSYEIYRSSSAGSFAPNPTLPQPVPVLLGTVPANAPLLEVIDSSALALDNQVYWYAAKAVHIGPRGPLKSAFSAGVPWAARSQAAVAAPATVQTFSAPFCDRVICVKTAIINQPLGADPPGTVKVVIDRGSTDMAWVDITHLIHGIEPVRIMLGESENQTTYVFAAPQGVNASPPSYSMMLQAVSQGGVKSNSLALVTETSPSSSQAVVITVKVKTIPVDLIAPSNLEAASLLGPAFALANASFTALPDTPGSFSVVLPGSMTQGDVLVSGSLLGFPLLSMARVWQGKALVPFGPGLFVGGFSVYQVSGDPDSCRAGFHHRQAVPGVDPVTNTPIDSKITTMRVGFITPAGTKEYRVYRQVDNGPLGLVKQAELASETSTTLLVEDTGLPSTSACLGYYVQTLDKNGNSSPLQRLGQCIQLVTPLPPPTVGTPEFFGVVGSTLDPPRVRLTWSAAAVTGVDRFEITADPDDGGEVTPAEGNTAAPDAGGLINLRPTSRSNLSKVASIFSQRGKTPISRGYAIRKDAKTGQQRRTKTSPAEAFISPYLGKGTAFGAGPTFSQEFVIKPGVDYLFGVSSLGPSNGDNQARSPASAALKLRWAPPIPPSTELCTLPWPYKDLPPSLKFNDSIVARRMVPGPLDAPPFAQGERPVWPNGDRNNYPVGVRIGRIDSYGSGPVGGIATIQGHTTTTTADDGVQFDKTTFTLGNQVDLHNALFKSTKSRLLPVVMYRRQVPSLGFPNPPDTVVQCSPRINSLVFQGNIATGPRLRDPYIGVTAFGSNYDAAAFPLLAGTDEGGARLPSSVHFYLLDTKPVLNGATYHYYLIRFDAGDEPAEVIDAGEVEIPE